MRIDTKHINTIKRVVSAGYTDEKSIAAISISEAAKISKTLPEVKDVAELQSAIEEHRLLEYIIMKEPGDSIEP